MKRDPRILQAKYRSTGFLRDWRDTQNDTRWLCNDGVDDWFEIPQGCSELWLVISPFADEDSYPIDKRGSPQDYEGRHAGVIGSVRLWIRDHMRKFPKYHFYLSIEVLDEPNRRT